MIYCSANRYVTTNLSFNMLEIIDIHMPCFTNSLLRRFQSASFPLTDGVSEAGEEEVEFAGPVASLGVLISLVEVVGGLGRLLHRGHAVVGHLWGRSRR